MESEQMMCTCVDADGAVCVRLRVEPFDVDRAADLAGGFKALGDPHRVAILHLLAGAGEPVCVVDVERHIDLAQSTISYHLKALVDAGVIHRERRGKWSFYSIVEDRLIQLSAEINSLADAEISLT
jgi:ArsR family transcriptional regulator, arsenate/arsenite/antimonite-responsive transcriptional repressor